MRPLDIIIVNDYAHINGGAAKVALQSAMALADRGHWVTVLAAVSPILPELHQHGVTVSCTDQRDIARNPNRLQASCQGVWNRAAVAAMRRLLAEKDPRTTIVHIHGWTKALSSSVVREAMNYRAHIIITLHDYFSTCPNGGFYNYPQAQICRLKGMSLKCIMTHCDKTGYSHKLWRVARQSVQKRQGGIPDRIKHYIAISDFSKKIIQPYLPAEAVVHDIPNPVAVEKQPAADPGRSSAFAFVGRLTPEKGIFLFAEACRRADVKSVFVGDGECRAELERRFPEAICTGWLAEQGVRHIMADSRAVLLPSLWYETQGLVVLEAAALGIPAIVADSCAGREYVVDGVTGLWFKGGDSGDLAKQISRLKDAALAGQMGLAAYDAFWSNPPTIDRHVSMLESVYGKMIGSR